MATVYPLAPPSVTRQMETLAVAPLSRRQWLTGVAGLLALGARPALATGAGPTVPAGLAAGPVATAVEIIDGDTVKLDDGREARMVGIQAPKLPLGRRGFKAWPLADEARAHLERSCLGRRLSLWFGETADDRHGRRLAHLVRDDGLWLQGEMLRRGLARVYTFADNRLAAAELLAEERAARAARRGVWTHPYYAIREANRPAELLQLVDRFELVEGRILRVERAKGVTYLNFGEDWKTDFTLAVDGSDLRHFRARRIDLKGYEGRQVRVRGWIRSRNGPSMDLTHPEQLEEL